MRTQLTPSGFLTTDDAPIMHLEVTWPCCLRTITPSALKVCSLPPTHLQLLFIWLLSEQCVWDPGHLLFSPPPLFFLLWMEFHLSRRETFAELSWRVMGGDRSLSRHFRYDTFSLIWAVLTVLCVVCSGLRLKFYCSASRFRWQMFVCIPR